MVALDGGDERTFLVGEVCDDRFVLVVDDDGVVCAVGWVVDDDVRPIVKRKLGVAAGDLAFAVDLAEATPGGLLVDFGQREPTALVGEDTVVLLSSGKAMMSKIPIGRCSSLIATPLTRIESSERA